MTSQNTDLKTIWKTNVGSHMWGMNRPDSDVDIFEAYSIPTKEMLRGFMRQNSHNSTVGDVDMVKHEVGKVVDMLISGNLNFVMGVMSPIILEDSIYLQDLRRIYMGNISKNIYHSIHGMALHNYKKYFEKEKDCSWKKLAQVLRIINFGNAILLYGKIEFVAIPKDTPITIFDIKHKISELENAYAMSVLPMKPDDNLFRNWLYKLRLDDLNDAIDYL